MIKEKSDTLSNHYYDSIKNPICNEYIMTRENYHDIRWEKNNRENGVIFDNVKVRGLFREKGVKEI